MRREDDGFKSFYDVTQMFIQESKVISLPVFEDYCEIFKTQVQND